MDKVYTLHEIAYQNLKNKGAKSWHEMYANPEGKEVDHIGFSRKIFIEDALEKDYCPKSGNALEIGTGTGHLINFIKEKGYIPHGIEISSTALELARKQHKDIDFKQGDYCYDDIYQENFFDLIIDGSCFHCIVD
ncbi:MAG: class I SAM-dependent methyltransferase, partial [Candidatus Sericytochromatia bacterium]